MSSKAIDMDGVPVKLPHDFWIAPLRSSAPKYGILALKDIASDGNMINAYQLSYAIHSIQIIIQ